MAGEIDLTTTTLENFHFSGTSEKVEPVKRDTLGLFGERNLGTTHDEFINFADKMSASNLRAVPAWFSEPKTSPIIIS